MSTNANCKSLSTPRVPHQRPSIEDNNLFSPIYRSLVGGLQYLTFTRPDISLSINFACQFMHNPTNYNFQLIKRILQGTLDHGIRLFSQNSLELYGYSDADWGGCHITRHSTTRFCTFLGTNCIS